jgi:hypothetical protein
MEQEPPEKHTLLITNSFWFVASNAILLLSSALPTEIKKFLRGVQCSVIVS